MIKYIVTALILLVSSAVSAAEVNVKGNGTYEECFDMGEGDLLFYSFEATDGLNFNVHYHAEPDHRAVYLVQEEGTTMLNDSVEIPAQDKYCLMWTNPHWAPVELEYKS